jgi:hypothetical protein
VARSISLVLAGASLVVVSYLGFRFIGNSPPFAPEQGDSRVDGQRVTQSTGIAEPLSPVRNASSLSHPDVEPTSSDNRLVLDIVIANHSTAPFHTVKVKKGDTVTISVDSDEAGKLEVHGYRKELAIVPEAKAAMTFVADKTGRFPIDLHARRGTHIEAAVLEVMPR